MYQTIERKLFQFWVQISRQPGGQHAGEYFPQKEIRNSKNSTLFIFQILLLLDITAVKVFVFFQLTVVHLKVCQSEL
jgi:hypothetical protein